VNYFDWFANVLIKICGKICRSPEGGESRGAPALHFPRETRLEGFAESGVCVRECAPAPEAARRQAP
jgi:hypothetical protein